MNQPPLIPITIDTREQTPWDLDPTSFSPQIATLRTGDYAITGDAHFAIERKSQEDFLGTIGTGWARFCRELNRMDDADFGAKVIIVEGSYISTTFQITPQGDIIPPQHRHWMITPQFVNKRIAELTMRGVSVLFAHNSDLAAALAGALFIQRWRQILNQTQTLQNSSESATK